MNRFAPVALGLLLALAAPALAQAPADVAAATTPSLYDDPALVQSYQQTITEDELTGLLHFFASDFFEGRETTARGQRMAAAFLAQQFMDMGAQPAGTVEDEADPLARYYQPFPLQERRLDRSVLTVYGADSSTVLLTSTFSRDGVDGQSYLAYGGSGTPSAAAGVVFGGYGVNTDTYSDIEALQEAGLDLSGKWVLLLDDEPMNVAGTESLITEDGLFSEFSTQWFNKLRAAYNLGQPAGFLIVSDRSPRQPTPLTVRAEAALRQVGSLSLEGGSARSFRLPPIFRVSSAVADALLTPGGQTIAGLQAEIDAALTPTVFEIPGVVIGTEIAYATETVSTENVVAYVEGSDPQLRDEVVVLSAHYDHVGIIGESTGDTINNGADDDGSGTMALVEVAEAFAEAAAAGYGPRRTVVFLAVSGEEKGLLGSAYYADAEPLFPLESTVANLNMDMIGRTDPTYPGEQMDNYVYIIGGKLISEEIQTITEQANALTGLGMDLNERFNSKDDPNRFYRRSDHWNFGKHGIPFIFYFNGTHEDYHQVGDEPHKIDYPQLTRRAQLIFATAWQIANQDTRVAVSGMGFN